MRVVFATVSSIGSGPIGVGIVAVLDRIQVVPWSTGIAMIASCDVINSEGSPTFSITLGTVKVAPGCSVFCKRAEVMIQFVTPTGRLEKHSLYRESWRFIVVSCCSMWIWSEKPTLKCATSGTICGSEVHGAPFEQQYLRHLG